MHIVFFSKLFYNFMYIRYIELVVIQLFFLMNKSVVGFKFLIDFFSRFVTHLFFIFTHLQCSLVLLAFFVVAISADAAEKQSENQSATNAEGSVKDKRAIHITSYHASPYVYHSPVVVHHSAPLIHAAPIVHHPVVHHAVHPVYSSHVISHAPLVSYHYGRR